MVTQIQTRQVEPDITVVDVSGQLHAGNTLLSVESTLKKLIEGGVRKLVLDFSELKLIDSSGIGVLVVCSAQIRERGGMLRIACPPGTVAHVLELVNLGQVVQIDSDLESACSKFRAASAEV
jgi:anti-sigma B factor antagonist